ncbi:MAG: hypothetical protein ABI846_16030, partial [Rudaea sp.]
MVVEWVMRVILAACQDNHADADFLTALPRGCRPTRSRAAPILRQMVDEELHLVGEDVAVG